MGLEEASSISDSDLVEKTAGPLINIIEAILNTGGEYVSSGILAICNAFTLKCSPCLHMLLFQMLKRVVIEDSTLSSKSLIKILLENKAVQNDQKSSTNMVIRKRRLIIGGLVKDQREGLNKLFLVEFV